MSLKENDAYIEDLWEQYQELKYSWDGKDLKHEEMMNDVAGELISLGVDESKL